jgi:large conductance mechanosensitive channel
VAVVSLFARSSKRTYAILSVSITMNLFTFVRFALRGNMFDLAIGIVIGTAFSNVVQSLVNDIITPPFGLLLGGVDFVNLTVSIPNFVYQNQPPVVIRYGRFIQQILFLLIVAFTLFFIIKLINKLHKIALKKKVDIEKAVVKELSDEVKVLREIRDLLTPRTVHIHQQ